MKRVHLALVPRDGFFCKDGRDWFASASGRGHGLEWPWPSTILGALRTAWGRAEEERSKSRFGPDDWLQRTKLVQLGRVVALRRPQGAQWAAEHMVWPAPLDAVRFEGEQHIQWLDPCPHAGRTLGRDDDPAREALWWPALLRSDKPAKMPRWWRHSDMVAWLTRSPVRIWDDKDGVALGRRYQVRVAIRGEELTAEESALFSHDVAETLEPRNEWAIGVEARFPEGDLPKVATLGSDSRPARVEPLSQSVFDPPERLLAAFRPGSRGLRIVVVTPACFERGWLPDGLLEQSREYRGPLAGLGELVLRAAFVPRPMHASGWDMAARKPKPVARLVAPGAVYFFERADGRAFTEADARSLWCAALGARTEEGFGLVVPGVWNPVGSNS